MMHFAPLALKQRDWILVRRCAHMFHSPGHPSVGFGGARLGCSIDERLKGLPWCCALCSLRSKETLDGQSTSRNPATCLVLVSLPFRTYVACNSNSTVFAGPQSQSLDLHCTQLQVASQHVRSTLLVWSAKACYTQLPSSLLPDRLRISSSEPTALSAGLLRSEISGVACLAAFRRRKPEIAFIKPAQG